MSEYVKLIENFLNELSKKHGLGEVTYQKIVDGDEIDEFFYIKISKRMTPHEKQFLWKEIIDDTKEFCEKNDLTEYLENMAIMLK